MSAIPNLNGISFAASSGSNSIVGGTSAGAGNLISGNDFDGIQILADGQLIQGNIIGLDSLGSDPIPNGSDGIEIRGGINSMIGGSASGARNVISGNTRNGIEIRDDSNFVQGNYIGLDSSGTRAVSNGLSWILVISSSNTIGGTVVGARNFISGNGLAGIEIVGIGSNTIIFANRCEGNIIGLSASASTIVANRFGILITNSANNTIGGDTEESWNIISANASNAITIGKSLNESNSVGNAVLGNAIWNNGALGADLANDGVTANDNPDEDPGPNNLQNYPFNITATCDGTNTFVDCRLRGEADSPYLFQYYGNTLGREEGQMFLGSTNMNSPPGDGNIPSFTISLPPVVDGVAIAITATQTNLNDTSELSSPELVVFTVPIDTDNDGVPDSIDEDIDNDGIPNILEGSGENGTNLSPFCMIKTLKIRDENAIMAHAKNNTDIPRVSRTYTTSETPFKATETCR
ncbi:MAG: hypothetical protein GKR87_09835 [Kiritimatiellae bacterium]|nr:hypothetical protein [Kiritimatiellia bacterium]